MLPAMSLDRDRQWYTHNCVCTENQYELSVCGVQTESGCILEVTIYTSIEVLEKKSCRCCHLINS